MQEGWKGKESKQNPHTSDIQKLNVESYFQRYSKCWKTLKEGIQLGILVFFYFNFKVLGWGSRQQVTSVAPK